MLPEHQNKLSRTGPCSGCLERFRHFFKILGPSFGTDAFRSLFGHVLDTFRTPLGRCSGPKKQTASRGIVVCFGIRVPLASARARAPTGNRRHIHPLLRTHDVPHHACMQTTSSPTCIQPHEHRAYTLHCHGATPMRRHPLTRHKPTMDNITVMSLSLHPSPRGLCCPSD